MNRVLVPEEMDDESLDPKAHVHALRGLARINFFSRGAQNIWPFIEALAKKDPQKKLRVLDIATGSGDIPVWLWRKAKKEGVLLEIEGCDKSSQALDSARQRARENKAEVRFFTLNIFNEELPDGYDILINSLFLHHLENKEACNLLRRMAERAKRSVIVSDLARSGRGLFLAYFGTRLLTASSVVHTDGVRSARAAFSIPEIKNILQSAGLDRARVERRWPSRFLVTWKKEELSSDAVRPH